MIAVGRIIQFQGNRGELKSKFYPGAEKLMAPGDRIYVGSENQGASYRVEAIRRKREFFIIKLEGVDSLEAALRLKGQEMAVEEERLPQLKEGEYYEHQLVGCSVRTKEDKEVGQVAGFWEISGKTVMVVAAQGKEILIPFETAICYEINLGQRVVRIAPPEGLLNLNEI